MDSASAKSETPVPASSARLGPFALLFLRVGSTVFGGGNPGMAILQREFERRGWLSRDRFALAYGLARLTPGTNFLAFCAAAGWYVLGISGALIAVLATTIPASVLVIWLTQAEEIGSRHPLTQSIIAAVIAATVGMMFGFAFTLIRSQCSKTPWLRPACVALGAFLLSHVGLSPLSIIALAAVLGFFWVES